MTVIDLKTEQRKGNYSLISDELLDMIKFSLQNKQKIVLFHNRKQYARRIYCTDCRLLITCENCHVPIIGLDQNHGYSTYCSLCGKSYLISFCPNCKATQLKPSGFGIPKLKEQLNKVLEQKALITTSDKLLLHTFLDTLKYNNILISTEPPPLNIVKPNSDIYCAAIIEADTNLYLPDFTASLRLFNRICLFKKFCKELRVAKLFIQTYNPQHCAITYAVKENIDEFIKKELEERKLLNYPPYATLIKVLYQDQNEKRVQGETQKLYKKLFYLSKSDRTFTISPPLRSWVYKVRGNYRYQMLIKTQNSKLKSQNHNSKLKTILTALSPAWLIDVDPISVL